MQNRYAGDAGDFVTFGLLRWLTPTRAADPLRLGVVWYLTVDETHNADGKHVAYLDPDHPVGKRLRRLDADLYDRLAGVVASGRRSVASLAAAGMLAPGTRYFDDVLDLADLPVAARAARRQRRAAWLQRALAATAGCDLVFADPDNGIRSGGHGAGAHRTKAVKHAYLDELAAFASRGQSLIAYQHADRSAPVDEQATVRLDELAAEVPVRPIAAVSARRGSARLFLIGAASDDHATYLRRRLRVLQESPWAAELTVLWRRRVGATRARPPATRIRTCWPRACR